MTKIPFSYQNLTTTLQELAGLVNRFLDKRAGRRVPFVLVLHTGKGARFVSNIPEPQRTDLLKELATGKGAEPVTIDESTEVKSEIKRHVTPNSIYPPICGEDLGPHYLRHVDHMTREGLHAKSDIAVQLAYRDKVIEELRGEQLRLTRSLFDARMAAQTKGQTGALKIGGRYNWRGQAERLIYLGRNWSGNGFWHQFALVDHPDKVWSEVTDSDIGHFEETPP